MTSSISTSTPSESSGRRPAPLDAELFLHPRIEPLGWATLPPAAHTWTLDVRTGACAVFFGDKFYLYYAHF